MSIPAFTVKPLVSQATPPPVVTKTGRWPVAVFAQTADIAVRLGGAGRPSRESTVIPAPPKLTGVVPCTKRSGPTRRSSTTRFCGACSPLLGFTRVSVGVVAAADCEAVPEYSRLSASGQGHCARAEGGRRRRCRASLWRSSPSSRSRTRQ